MKYLSLIIGALLLVGICAQAQTQPELNLMPMPASVQAGSGQLPVTTSFRVAISGKPTARMQHAAERFINRLQRQTGIPISIKLAEASQGTLILSADKPGESVPKLGEDESYRLEVTPTVARIAAPTDLGVLRGIETFAQLVQSGPDGFFVPAVIIADQPRFPWRGLMIDVSRHWSPVEVIKRNLDAMAAVKMNVFHWHLSDDQAFRIESKKFPKLHELGSGGLYYTQDQVREVVAYAHDRGIRVIPEFDMPGHATAWFVGHPELASGPGPYAMEKKFGIFDPAMDPTRESTYKFLDKFIGEMAALFPDPYFHIGGDEVNGKEWDANPKIQEFKRAHTMKSNEDLQAYFTKRVQDIVKKHKKTMVGWDEVLHDDTPKDVVIQSWRGPKGLAQAARAGHRVLLSNGYYIDLMFPARDHYLNEPVSGDAANLTPEQQKLILGGEATSWAELVTPETIDSRIWPRTAAIAERFWSPKSVTDVDSMYRRLAVVSHNLDWTGVIHNSYYEQAIERIAGPANTHSLMVLADVLEPPKEYKRHAIDKNLSTDTSYTRLVDVLKPESDSAREFSRLVDRILAGQASPKEKTRLRAILLRWRDNGVHLQTVLESGNFLQKELAPVSQNVAAVATAALQAIDYLETRITPPPTWAQQQLAVIDLAKKPQASTLIMIAPPIQKLVQAAQGGVAVAAQAP
ncbi:MAG TPA: family 20 glycosylhydrolase [Terriglobales bacterium]|nr:family 20 glycosylhydrolase [Terriglobales bacterium]